MQHLPIVLWKRFEQAKEWFMVVIDNDEEMLIWSSAALAEGAVEC